MVNIDDLDEIKKLDKANVLGSIEQLGQQCEQAFKEASEITFLENYRQVSSIVFSGMGGSALGAYVLKSVFWEGLRLPLEVVNDYHLPAYVGGKTLVILGSYSGTTEETLACAQEARKKKACVTGFTTGGKLADFFRQNSYPAYIFNPKYNPSGQPRLGTGYSIFSLTAILKNLELLETSLSSLDDLLGFLKSGNDLYGINCYSETNEAKKLARSWLEKIPIIVGGEFLGNVGRVIRNQLHESAKSFADFHVLPELNHHLMEGLKNPSANKNLLTFLFLESALYSDRIRNRLKITKEVISQNDIDIASFTPKSSEKLSQAMECIQFGAYTNYYLALLYGLDPSKIPWVDFFKEKLAKSS